MAFTDIDETYPRGTQKVSILDDYERETRSWLKDSLKQISGYPDVATPKVMLWTTATRPSALQGGLLGYNTTTGHLEIALDNGSGTVSLADIVDNMIAATKLADHPVGSYLFTSDGNYNPNTSIGGTWVRDVGEGRCLISAGATYGLGADGGSFTHTLSIAEMPNHAHSAWTDSQGNHRHAIWANNWETGGGSGGMGNQSNLQRIWGYTDYAGGHSHNVGIGATGGSAAFNIMNPWHGVYIWHRTA